MHLINYVNFLCSETFRSPDHRIFSVGCRIGSPSVARHLFGPSLVPDRHASVGGRRTSELAIRERSSLAAVANASSEAPLSVYQ